MHSHFGNIVPFELWNFYRNSQFGMWRKMRWQFMVCSYLLLKVGIGCKLYQNIFLAFLGTTSSPECPPSATTAGISNTSLIVTDEALKGVGDDLQFFVNCSQPYGIIILATPRVKSAKPITISKPLTIDTLNISKAVFTCPPQGMVFDIRYRQLCLSAFMQMWGILSFCAIFDCSNIDLPMNYVIPYRFSVNSHEIQAFSSRCCLFFPQINLLICGNGDA